MSDIALTVLDDMRLFISPEEIGRDTEHNSATFRVTQPPELDQYACRAEVQTEAGTTYRVVTNGEFALTNDMTVRGLGRIQLVYSDGADVLRKTRVAPFHISGSLNAVDPSAPEFADGLAQLQAAAFADAETQGTQLVFRNIGGDVVDQVTFPGSGLDEAQADTLYVRRDGTTYITGSLGFTNVPQGITFDLGRSGPIIYADGTSLRFRRATGDPDITIENSSGVEASRSAIMTMSASDLRYQTQATSDARYLRQEGGFITGPIRHLGAPAPQFDETLVTREYVQSYSYNMGFLTQSAADARYLSQGGGTVTAPITAIGWPAPDLSHLVPRSWVEGATLSNQGGQLSGPLYMATGQPIISAMGVGSNPMLCIGTNDSGFWRTAGTIVFEVGRAPTWLYSGTTTLTYVPLSLVGPPTATLHAATKGYVDERLAPALKFDIPVDVLLTATWQNLYSIGYPIPRGGLSRVRVSVAASCRTMQQGGLSIVGVSCHPEIAIDRIERHFFVYNLNGVSSGVTAEFTMEVNGANPILTIQVAVLVTNPTGNDVTIIGGDTFVQERSQVTIADLGPR